MSDTGSTDPIVASLRERERMLVARHNEMMDGLRGVAHELHRTRTAISALDPSAPKAVTPAPIAPVQIGLTDAAYDILRTAGKPMHVRELIERLRGRGIHPDMAYDRFRDSLNGTIGRKARAGVVFTAEGRGEYGLAEWRPKAVGTAPKAKRKNTDLVVKYVTDHQGLTRKQIVEAVKDQIATNTKRGSRTTAALVIVVKMIKDGRVEERDGKLYPAGLPPVLSLMGNTSVA